MKSLRHAVTLPACKQQPCKSRRPKEKCMNDARAQHQLEASLDHLLARVTTLRVLRLRPEEQTCLVQAIERTRMQLLGSPEPVLVVVLAGGTGVWKSALINALAGAPI